MYHCQNPPEIDRFKQKMPAAQEIVKNKMFQISIRVRNRNTYLRVFIPPKFPYLPPRIFLKKFVHPWITYPESGRFDKSPELLSWGIDHRDIFKVVDQIIKELNAEVLPILNHVEPLCNDWQYIRVKCDKFNVFDGMSMRELLEYTDLPRVKMETKHRLQELLQLYKLSIQYIRDLVSLGFMKTRNAVKIRAIKLKQYKEEKENIIKNCRYNQFEEIMRQYDRPVIRFCVRRDVTKKDQTPGVEQSSDEKLVGYFKYY